MTDRPTLTFTGLLGLAPSTPSNLDKHGRPYVRRTNDGHVIVITDPLKLFPPLSWLVVYASCPDSCDGGKGPNPHRTDLIQGDRLGDEHVGAWPFLNQWGYHEDWVLEQIDGLQRAIKTHQRTYGEQSKKIGAVRAELARARQRIRELEAAQPDESAEEEQPRRGNIDWAAIAREAIGANLAAPIHGFPDAESSRRRVLKSAGVVVDADGWVAGLQRPKHQGKTGCHEVDGTWLHYGPEHDCPKWMRG